MSGGYFTNYNYYILSVFTQIGILVYPPPPFALVILHVNSSLRDDEASNNNYLLLVYIHTQFISTEQICVQNCVNTRAFPTNICTI